MGWLSCFDFSRWRRSDDTEPRREATQSLLSRTHRSIAEAVAVSMCARWRNRCCPEWRARLRLAPVTDSSRSIADQATRRTDSLLNRLFRFALRREERF